MSNIAHVQMTVVLGIIENAGRFLIIRRVDNEPMWHHKWELPGGKIEPGETPLEALHREIREETGLSVSSPKLLGIHTHHWHLPDRTQQTFLLAYRGQVNRPAEPIALDPAENDAFRWVTLEEYLAIPEAEHLGANREMILQLYTSKDKQ